MAALLLSALLLTQLPAPLREAAATRPGPVETEMRNIVYRIDAGVSLRIAYLRGALRQTGAAPPWFEDPASFAIAIDSAETSITPASLGGLLNRYVFNYEGSPLRRLEVRIIGTQLELQGTLHKGVPVRFRMLGDLSMTNDGRLRLHPVSVRVLGVSAAGLMRLFSIELDDLVRVRGNRGVEVDGNDMLLSPAALLPPPRIAGRLTAMRVRAADIVLVFGTATRSAFLPRLVRGDTTAANYMYFQGGVLRFGKLTMAQTDLTIVDADPRDPFDFYLAKLNDQLVAGRTRNLADFGLVTVMPDFDDLRPSRSNP